MSDTFLAGQLASAASTCRANSDPPHVVVNVSPSSATRNSQVSLFARLLEITRQRTNCPSRGDDQEEDEGEQPRPGNEDYSSGSVSPGVPDDINPTFHVVAEAATTLSSESTNKKIKDSSLGTYEYHPAPGSSPTRLPELLIESPLDVVDKAALLGTVTIPKAVPAPRSPVELSSSVSRLPGHDQRHGNQTVGSHRSSNFDHSDVDGVSRETVTTGKETCGKGQTQRSSKLPVLGSPRLRSSGESDPSASQLASCEESTKGTLEQWTTIGEPPGYLCTGSPEWASLSCAAAECEPVTSDNVPYPSIMHYFYQTLFARFGATTAADKIRTATSPKEAVALGRSILNGSHRVPDVPLCRIIPIADWAQSKGVHLLELAVMQIFSKKTEMRSLLLRSGDLLVIETGLLDTFWGAGWSSCSLIRYIQDQNLTPAALCKLFGHPSAGSILGENRYGLLLIRIRSFFRSLANSAPRTGLPVLASCAGREQSSASLGPQPAKLTCDQAQCSTSDKSCIQSANLPDASVLEVGYTVNSVEESASLVNSQDGITKDAQTRGSSNTGDVGTASSSNTVDSVITEQSSHTDAAGTESPATLLKRLGFGKATPPPGSLAARLHDARHDILRLQRHRSPLSAAAPTPQPFVVNGVPFFNLFSFYYAEMFHAQGYPKVAYMFQQMRDPVLVLAAVARAVSQPQDDGQHGINKALVGRFETWEAATGRTLMLEVIRAMVLQVDGWQERLQATGQKFLIQLDLKDTYWGCTDALPGMLKRYYTVSSGRVSPAVAFSLINKAMPFLGQNRLGLMLGEVRDSLSSNPSPPVPMSLVPNAADIAATSSEAGRMVQQPTNVSNPSLFDIQAERRRQHNKHNDTSSAGDNTRCGAVNISALHKDLFAPLPDSPRTTGLSGGAGGAPCESRNRGCEDEGTTRHRSYSKDNSGASARKRGQSSRGTADDTVKRFKL